MENISAIEWLLNEMSAKDWWYLPESMKQDIIDQAKAMEKEQMMGAWDNGNQWEWDSNIRNSEEYYNKTFKSE